MSNESLKQNPNSEDQDPALEALRLVRGASRLVRKRAQEILDGDNPVIAIGAYGDGCYRVPAWTQGKLHYTVVLTREAVFCECAYHTRIDETGSRLICKHMVAAANWEAARRADGVDVEQFNKRETHRNPDGYDAMKAMVVRGSRELLRCMVQEINVSRRCESGRGRRPKAMRDILFEIVFQAKTKMAHRDAIHDPHALLRDGFITGNMAPGTRLRCMSLPAVLVQLRQLLRQTTEAVRPHDTIFAFDSTSFKTPNYGGRREHIWRDGSVHYTKVINCKLHLSIALPSQMIAAARVTDGDDPDIVQFETLVRETNEVFRVAEVLADAGYYAFESYELVRSIGALAFIDFPQDAKFSKKDAPERSAHDEALRIYKNRPDVWNLHYHPRSIIESSNGAIKRLYYRVIRARTAAGREAEILALCISYNLERLVRLHVLDGLMIPFADQRALAVMRGVDPVLENKRGDRVFELKRA